MHERLYNSRLRGCYNQRLVRKDEVHTLSIAHGRTLLRREHDYNRTLKEQTFHGRPDYSWKMCGEQDCTSCMYTDQLFMVERMDYYGIRGQSFAATTRIDLFTKTMVKVNFGINEEDDKFSEKCWAVESFFESPPVRAAFQEFKLMLGDLGRNPTAKKLAQELSPLLPCAVHLVKCPRLSDGISYNRKRDIHNLLRPVPYFERSDDWSLSDCGLKFCARIESWRRYGISRGRHWSFGEPKDVAVFLCSILLDMWIMDIKGCFENAQYTDTILNSVWQEWLDRYLPGNEQGVRKFSKGGNSTRDGDHTIGGVGQGSAPWMSQRMQWSVDLKRTVKKKAVKKG